MPNLSAADREYLSQELRLSLKDFNLSIDNSQLLLIRGDARTTTKEYKNIYKESSTIVEPKKSISLTLAENIEKRNKSFYESLVPFVEVYGKELIRAFFDYWTEPNKSKTKMRFELEKTWDVKRRLNTWASRDKINSKLHGTDKTKASEQRASEILELNKRLNDAGY